MVPRKPLSTYHRRMISDVLQCAGEMARIGSDWIALEYPTAHTMIMLMDRTVPGSRNATRWWPVEWFRLWHSFPGSRFY